MTLYAEPESGSHFVEWTNGCTGLGTTCNVALDDVTTVTANFREIAVVQVVAGNSHTCVLLDTGAVRCWGIGGTGALGYGNQFTIGDDETPASAGDVPLGGIATGLTAGGGHTCALLSTGAVRCWGGNTFGQLGYGNTDSIGDDETPVAAGDVPVGGTVTHIAAGVEHTCARLSTGAVRCWGRGLFGRLGYADEMNIGDDETPASAGDVVVGRFVVEIATGANHTCAVTDSAQVRCWGGGSQGKLGYGNTDSIGDDETPASAGDVFIDGNADQIALGEFQTCARKGTSLLCWGGAIDGILGYGDTTSIGDDEFPGTVGDVPVGVALAQVSAGNTHTCARLTTGAVRCWGAAFAGQLGYGNVQYIGDDETPASVGDVPVGDTVTDIATGDQHTCVILSSGGVRCWGWGFRGRLGYGNEITIGDDETPESAGDVPLF